MVEHPGILPTRQKTRWLPSSSDEAITALLLNAGATEVRILYRRVSDGELRAICSCDPPDFLWHLSVNHEQSKSRRAPRYPTWDELTDARYQLLPPNIDVVMYLPPPEEYVTVHDTTFHLHELRKT